MMHTKAELLHILQVITPMTVTEARNYVNSRIKPSDLIAKDAFYAALYIRDKLYKESDKGRKGKTEEISTRVTEWINSGRSWARWCEFNARKQGKRDTSKVTYHKAGAGDWLRSKTADTREAILHEYMTFPAHRDQTFKFIDMERDFCIMGCTLGDFLQYLAQYKGGLYTWFKSNVTYTEDSTVVQFQTYTNSKTKIKYLQDCPWNIFRTDENDND